LATSVGVVLIVWILQGARAETIKLWAERLDWLTGLVDPDPLLAGITHTKLRQFATEAQESATP
jgi:hypothetical protein